MAINNRGALTEDLQRDVSSLLLELCRVGAAAAVHAAVVGVLHREGDHAPGHAVAQLRAGGQLCVAPVPGERGRRVAALRDTRERHPLADTQGRARLVAQDSRRPRRIWE